MTVNGKPLNDRQSYTLATTTYLAVEHGDGYDMLGGTFLIRPEQGQVESDILLHAFAAVRAIAPKIDARVKRIDAAKDKNACR